MPTIVPMVSYEDVGAAADWLVRAFGFRETGERYHDDEGRVTHAELAHGDGLVMLGMPGPHYRGPRRLAELSEDVRAMLDNPYVVDGVLVEVDDLDGCLERARAAGAEIIRGPEDSGFGRLFTAADPEGHRWMVSQSG